MQHNYHVSTVTLRPPTSSQSFKLQMNGCQDYLKHSQHLQIPAYPHKQEEKPWRNEAYSHLRNQGLPSRRTSQDLRGSTKSLNNRESS